MKAKIIIGIEIVLLILLLGACIVYGQVLIMRIFYPNGQPVSTVPTIIPPETTETPDKSDDTGISVAEKYELLKNTEAVVTTSPQEKRELLEKGPEEATPKLSPEEKMKLLKAQ